MTRIVLASLIFAFAALPAFAVELRVHICDSGESSCDVNIDDIGTLERETGETTTMTFHLDWMLEEVNEDLCHMSMGFLFNPDELSEDWDGSFPPSLRYSDPQIDIFHCAISIVTPIPNPNPGLQLAHCNITDTTDDGTGLLVRTGFAEVAVPMLVTGTSQIGAGAIQTVKFSSKQCWVDGLGCTSCTGPVPRSYSGGVEFEITSWDNCEVDDDADGYCDDADPDEAVTLHDNCVGIQNPTQLDTDGDGYGNVCDTDFNDDCVTGGPDLAAVFAHFGDGAPGWDGHSPPLGDHEAQKYDVNEDDVVGGPDLSVTYSNFGYPPGPSVDSPSCGL